MTGPLSFCETKVDARSNICAGLFEGQDISLYEVRPSDVQNVTPQSPERLELNSLGLYISCTKIAEPFMYSKLWGQGLGCVKVIIFE